MNERIRELASQLGLIYCEGDRMYHDDGTPMKISELEKFAELIVKECIQLALDEKQRYANISHRDMIECVVAMDNYQMLVKEHFGVDE
jgi:hypothetical protein